MDHEGTAQSVHVPAATSGGTANAVRCVVLRAFFFMWRLSPPFGETSNQKTKQKKKRQSKKPTLCAHLQTRCNGEKAALCAHVALPEEARAGGGRGSLLLPTLACQTGRLGELVLRQISLPIS